MSILINRETRVLVQGITSEYGGRQAAAMAQYGTRVVAGVTPGRGGSQAAGVPVFDSIREAAEAMAIDATAVYVPATKVPDAVMEATERRDWSI